MREQLACVAALCAAGAHWESGEGARLVRAWSRGGAGLQPQSPLAHALGIDPSDGQGPSHGEAAHASTWDWSWRDLQSLPGIGPRRAATIVQARHFDVYARALAGSLALGGTLEGASSPGAGPRLGRDATTHLGAARAWRGTGPELLDLLPGIGPATVEALRPHWRAQAKLSQEEAAATLRKGRAAAPVEYTPPPARPP